MNSFLNKVAIVTGGNSGIGFATAAALAAAGARVLIVGRRQAAVDEAVAALGKHVIGLVGDVADPMTHDRVAETVRDRFGGADIYIANAGVNVIQPSEAVTQEDYDAQFAINARGVFFGVQKIVPLMREGGSIVLTSSIATRKILEGHAVYAGAKAAMEAFARSWALELKARRIRVNVVSPGPVDTPILGKLGVPDDARDGFEAHLANVIPMGRLGQADELARSILYLASDDAGFVTGANLLVDGGIALT
ncbi:SDR family oxidoreductase [Sphingobium sp. BYY-5]|uniref:SDR family NAD(P)-dependent oxidoreductase n=1 Tax=Sphingobium sp. BYY-5 TaxID=2926400 RepID=UPI001FA73323|nr:SDR family oxidoreductase [Sphingobium sp. BYY-5]MCI4590823.1 SDR family oxidoreductase [Sphingobium sp. BYY-5]